MANEQSQVDIKIVADATSVVNSAKTIGDLKTAITSVNTELNKSDFGSQKFNDLSKVLDQANTKLTTGGSQLKAFTGAMSEFGSTIPGVSGAMKVLNLVIEANPFGLLFAAISSAVAILSQFQSVTDPIANVMAGINTVIKSLIHNFGKFSGAFEKFILMDYAGAYNDLKEGINGVTDAFEKGSDAADRQHKLEQKIITDGPKLAQQASDLIKLKELAAIKDGDQRKNQEAAIALEEKITATKSENAQEQVAITKEKYKAEGKLDIINDGKHREEAKILADQEAAAINVVSEGEQSIRRVKIAYANENIKDGKEASKKEEQYLKEKEKLRIEYVDSDIEKIQDKAKKDIALLKKSDKDYVKIVTAINEKRDKEIDKINKKKLKEEKDILDKINKLQEQASLDTDQIELGKAKAVETLQKSEIKLVEDKYKGELELAKGNKTKIAEIEAAKAAELKPLREKEIIDIQDVSQKEIDVANGVKDEKISAIDETANKEIEAANGNADLIAAINAKRNADILKAQQDLSDDVVKIESSANDQIAKLREQDVADAAKASETKKKKDEEDRKESFEVAKGLMAALDSLGNLFDELEGQRRNQSLAQKKKAAEKEFKVHKALSIVKAAITTAEGTINALSQWDKYPLNIVNAVINAAAGAAEIAVIAAKKFDPNSVGGGSTSGGASIPSGGGGGGSAGQPSFQASTFHNLGNQTPNQANQQQSSQVYVTTTDLNNAQGKVAVTQNRSKIG